jgi:hypothetical protein
MHLVVYTVKILFHDISSQLMAPEKERSDREQDTLGENILHQLIINLFIYSCDSFGSNIGLNDQHIRQ